MVAIANPDLQVNQVMTQQPSVAQPPALALTQMIWGTWISQAIYAAASLGIADLLITGAQPVEWLAAQTKADATKLYRVLRTLASVGVFTEVSPKTFALTEMAHYLRSDIPDTLRYASMMLSDNWHWNSWGDILHVMQNDQSAMQHLYGVDSTFEYLEQHPESTRLYNLTMSGWSKNVHTATVNVYDFSGFQNIVDIAGGQGTLIAAILAANPTLQGILFDQPHVVETAQTILQREGVRDRCTTVGGNFFESVPAGADAYIMSHILHDWSDADCIRILEQVRRNMDPNGKLLVVEMVVPEDNSFDYSKWMDIDMMIMYPEGRERTAAEFRDLFRASGFELTRILRTASPISVIEGVCA
jgi:ubiquinone/menaquinone biosynthesis C-methylase UbiE